MKKNIKLPKPQFKKHPELKFGSLKFTPDSEAVPGRNGENPEIVLESIRKAIKENVFNNENKDE